MIQKKFFEQHYVRLRTHGIIKAALSGLTVGLFTVFVAATVAWFFGFGGIWFGLGIGLGVGAVSGVILYFTKFKPTTKQIARRVDMLGLDERLITMLELEQDESYIAMRQRENAKEHLKKADPKRLRLGLPVLVFVLAGVAMVLASGMTTVVGLADRNIVPSGMEIVAPEDPMENYIAITYMVEEGGEIAGEGDQLILPGETTTPVVAVEEEGWVFVGWDDGYKGKERSDAGLTEDAVFIAIFQEIGEDGEGSENENESNGESGSKEGDEADDLPGGGEANVDSEQQGGQGDEGNGSGSDANEDGGKGESEDQGVGNGEGQGSGSGGTWQDNNTFLDGVAQYRDYLDLYYQIAEEIFAANGDIPPELREFFENYYDGI